MMAQRASKLLHAGLAAAGLALLGGCITERRPAEPPPGARPGATGAPAFPVARPALGSVTVTRVRVGVRPIGTVPYDGLTLPLVSPDGNLLAVQEGTAPGWPAVLALDDAVTPLGSRIVVYDIRDAAVRRVELAEELPPGVMLGRAADNEGFLVEWPRPEGGRWIGKVAWASGRVGWPVQGDQINAHAVLTTHGELLFTRRVPGEFSAELILGARDGHELARRAGGGASYMFPMTTRDPAAVYALVSGPSGLELESIGLVREPEVTGDPRWGATLARASVSNNGEPSMAYQIAAPLQATASLWQRPGDNAGPRSPEPIAVYHPRLERMAALSRRTGLFSALAERSIAAAYWGVPDEEGFFCTAPAGLVFVPYSPDRPPPPGTDARVLGGSYVPRATNHEQWPFVLFGPSRADPGRLEVAVMTVIRADAEAP